MHFDKYVLTHQGSIPGSPSEKAGMQKGDLIISVNGIVTHDMEEYIEAVQIRKNPMVVEVIRGQKFLTFTLELPALPIENPDYNGIVDSLSKAGVIPDSEEMEP